MFQRTVSRFDIYLPSYFLRNEIDTFLTYEYILQVVDNSWKYFIFGWIKNMISYFTMTIDVNILQQYEYLYVKGVAPLSMIEVCHSVYVWKTFVLPIQNELGVQGRSGDMA